MVVITKFYWQALVGRRVILKNFSTLAESNINTSDAHSQSLFAQFATTKLNLSYADIARIFKSNSKLERLQTLDKVEQVIRMLKKYGCQQHQIKSIVTTYPSLLNVNAERVVEPKIQLLTDSGIEGENLAKLLMTRPCIMGISLNNDLIPKMAFLRTIFQSQDSVIKALLRSPPLLCYNLEKTLKPSVAFWEGLGFSGTKLAKFLLACPLLLRYFSWTPAQVVFIHNIGVLKESKTYSLVLRIVAGSRMETLETRMHTLQTCGLSPEETWELFRDFPFIFSLSKEKLRKNMEFVVDNMDLPPNIVLRHTSWLRLSLEKVIKPRVAVWKKMKSMEGLGRLKPKPLLTILQMPEKRFLKTVKGHPKSTILYAIYENAIANVPSRTGISGTPFC